MLTIGQFSKIANVTTKTLRYYDEIQLLKPVYVDTFTGYRFYSADQLETVLLINRLKEYQFTLDDIANVLKNPLDQKLLSALFAQRKATIEQAISSYSDVLRELENDMCKLERGIPIMDYLNNIDVKLVESKPMNILFQRKTIDVSQYGALLGKVYETIVTQKLTPVGPPMSIHHGEEFDPQNYDVEVAVPIKEVVTGTRDLPSYLCAHSTLKGPYTQLTAVYTKLQKWAEENGYILAAAPFEIYLTDPNTTAPDDNVTELYLPVKK